MRGTRRSGTAALVVTRAAFRVDYLDSKLCFTYLLPAARRWEQNDDQLVPCFVTTPRAKLTSSVKGSKT